MIALTAKPTLTQLFIMDVALPMVWYPAISVNLCYNIMHVGLWFVRTFGMMSLVMIHYDDVVSWPRAGRQPTDNRAVVCVCER